MTSTTCRPGGSREISQKVLETGRLLRVSLLPQCAQCPGGVQPELPLGHHSPPGISHHAERVISGRMIPDNCYSSRKQLTWMGHYPTSWVICLSITSNSFQHECTLFLPRSSQLPPGRDLQCKPRTQEQAYPGLPGLLL